MAVQRSDRNSKSKRRDSKKLWESEDFNLESNTNMSSWRAPKNQGSTRKMTAITQHGSAPSQMKTVEVKADVAKQKNPSHARQFPDMRPEAEKIEKDLASTLGKLKSEDRRHFEADIWLIQAQTNYAKLDTLQSKNYISRARDSLSKFQQKIKDFISNKPVIPKLDLPETKPLASPSLNRGEKEGNAISDAKRSNPSGWNTAPHNKSFSKKINVPKLDLSKIELDKIPPAPPSGGNNKDENLLVRERRNSVYGVMPPINDPERIQEYDERMKAKSVPDAFVDPGISNTKDIKDAETKEGYNNKAKEIMFKLDKIASPIFEKLHSSVAGKDQNIIDITTLYNHINLKLQNISKTSLDRMDSVFKGIEKDMKEFEGKVNRLSPKEPETQKQEVSSSQIKRPSNN